MSNFAFSVILCSFLSRSINSSRSSSTVSGLLNTKPFDVLSTRNYEEKKNSDSADAKNSDGINMAVNVIVETYIELLFLLLYEGNNSSKLQEVTNSL